MARPPERTTSSLVVLPACIATWAALVVLCAGAVAGCDGLFGADAKVKRAEVKMSAGDLRGASADLKEALERAPGHARAHLLLAELSLRLGDAERAQKELDLARSLGPAGASSRDLEFRILQARGKFAELLSASQSDTSLPPPRRLSYAAAAYHGLGQFPEAEQAYRQALELAPDDAVVNLAWARFLGTQRRSAEAATVVDSVLARDPGNAEAAMIKGGLLIQAGRYGDARAALIQASEHGATQLSWPQQVSVAAGVVEANLLLADHAAAEQSLRALVAKAPQWEGTHLLAGRVALAKRDFASATSEFRRALQAAPGDARARLLLGAALFGQGSLEQATAELESLVAAAPESMAARRLLAEVYLAQNRPAEARKLLSAPSGGAGPDAASEWLMGQALLQSGDTGAGIAYLAKSAAVEPQNWRRQADLAAAYIAAGEREEALATLDRIPADAGGTRRSTLLVLANVLGSDPAHGTAAIDRLVSDHGKDPVVLALSGTYLASAGDLGRARELLGRAIDLDPSAPGARLALARVEVQAGRPEAADAQLRAILKSSPANQGAYLALSELASMRGDRAAAKALLEQGVGADPSAVDARLQLAGMAFRDGQADRARSLLEQVQKVSGGRPLATNAIGVVLLQAGQYDAALAKFNEAISLGLREARLNAARAQIALGHRDMAEAVVAEGVAADPAWSAGTALLAELQARQGRLKDALAHVATFRSAGGPRRAAAADEIEGDVQMIARHFDDAAAAYARAAALGPSNQLAVKAYTARHAAHSARAEEPLITWLAVHPADNSVRKILAAALQSNNDPKGAIAQYERIVGSGFAPDPVTLNNLAWLYQQAGDQRALDTARRAYGMAPDTPEIADTYGWILTQAGGAQDAVPILEKAAARARDRSEIQYHLAAAYVRTEQRDKARVLLEQALQAKGAAAWRADAEQLLRSLKS